METEPFDADFHTFVNVIDPVVLVNVVVVVVVLGVAQPPLGKSGQGKPLRRIVRSIAI